MRKKNLNISTLAKLTLLAKIHHRLPPSKLRGPLFKRQRAFQKAPLIPCCCLWH